MNFDRLDWRDDEHGFTLDGFDYVVEQHLDGPTPEGALRFYKPKAMVDRYAALLRRRPLPSNPAMLELGIYHGGSIAFWSTMLSPTTHLGIDYAAGSDSSAFARWLETSAACIDLHWGVDQADHAALATVLRDAAVSELDLVIDDASHKYAQTVASFDSLFDVLRPGGLYVIEDWAWSFDREFLLHHPEWRRHHSLASIVEDLHEAMARSPESIRSIESTPDFVVIERGETPLGRLAPSSVGRWNRDASRRRHALALRRRLRRGQPRR